MTERIKSDVDGLEFQQPGVLVGTDQKEYEHYVKRRNALNNKDAQIKELEERINILNEKLTKVLAYIEGNK